MVREVLADEAFLTGEEHLTVAELGVKVGINTRRGGLRPTQSGGSLKELTRHASQDHLGLRSVPGRLGLVVTTTSASLPAAARIRATSSSEKFGSVKPGMSRIFMVVSRPPVLARSHRADANVFSGRLAVQMLSAYRSSGSLERKLP